MGSSKPPFTLPNPSNFPTLIRCPMCALRSDELGQSDSGEEPTSGSATVSDGLEREKAADEGTQKFPATDLVEGPDSVSAEKSTEDADYPEGGLQALTVVLVFFCGMCAAFAMMNTMGIFQAYIAEHMLSDYTESAIGWIFSLYTFLVFFCGVQVGPLFDAYGPRLLILAGNVLLVTMIFLLGLCTEYYQFIIVFGIIGGAGTSLLFVPSIASVGHFFSRRRGMATGIAAGGGSIVGVEFSLMLQSLLPKLGFAWAARVLGFVFIVLCGLAQLLMRSRLPVRRGESVMPAFKIFKDPAFALLTAGVCFLEWGLFTPLTYVPSFALSTGAFDTAFAYQLIAILNAGSSLGRWGAGLVSDRIGRFNCLALTLLLCFGVTVGIWLPATLLAPLETASIKGLTIAYSLLFGIVSGANISLTPVCVGQLCDIHRYGRYYATCYTVVSLWTLPGIPIAGALLEHSNGRYWAVALFTSASYACAAIGILSVRVVKVGWRVAINF